MGCQLVLVPCNPCLLVGQLFAYDCPIQTTNCPVYPWQSNPVVESFASLFGFTLNSFLETNGLGFNDCNLNSLQTTWYVNVNFNGTDIISYPFFNGVGYNNVLSIPTETQWVSAITSSFVDLQDYGLSYILNENDTLTIYNNNCIPLGVEQTFELNVGINFNLLCN